MDLVSSPPALPPGWATTTLGDLLTILRGVSYDKKNATDTPQEGFIPILRATNITAILTFSDLVYVPNRYVSPGQMLLKGDIIVAASSGSTSVVGKAAPLLEDWCGSFGAFCYALRPAPQVYAKFLSFFTHTIEYRNQVSALAAGVNINNLRRHHVADIKVSLPPLPEQYRIVAEIERQFSLLDAGTAHLRRVQTKLRRYRASVLQDACAGRLVPTEAQQARAEGRDYEPADWLLARILAERRARWEADQLAKMEARGTLPISGAWKARYPEPAPPDTAGLADLPEGWVWASLEQWAAQEAASITDGPFGSNLKTEHYTDAGPRVIRLQNIGDGFFVNATAHITEERYLALVKHNVQAGDLVIAGLGERPPRSCIIPGGVGPAIVKADCIRVRVHPELVVAYLNAALNAESTRKRTEALVHGVGRPRLNLSEIKSIQVPLPPLAEQERIVAEVERRLSVIDQLEAVVTANLKRAARLRQAILKDAFAGRLVLQDPADEPARALLERIRAERAAAQASPKTTRKTPGTRTARPRKENADVSHGHQGGAGAGVPSGNARREPGTADKAPLPPDLFSANGG